MARILLIEDTANNRVLVSRQLERAGHEVLTAEDANLGLLAAKTELPDLILMDIGLPGIDGYEATRQLKADAVTKQIPVIALTAHAMPSDEEKAAAAGCDEYEVKPINFSRLFAKINTLLLHNRSEVPSPK